MDLIIKVPSKIFLVYLSVFFLLVSCSTTKYALKQKEKSISSIKFLDEYIIPLNQNFEQTIIGGLSGIDYDMENDRYFLISDDPSQFSAARIYTAKIGIKDYKLDTIGFTGITYMLQKNGAQYPKLGSTKTLKPDGESVRYNPITKQLLWSSEGERSFKNGDTMIVQPTLTNISLAGEFIDTIPLPKGFRFNKTETGLRKNALFEGTTYADHFKTLYVSLEEPMYEDGPKASYQYSKALTRILKFDVKTKQNTTQYAYNLNELPVKPTVDMDWNVNGISEILAVNQHTLLIMERAWAKGNDDHSFIKLYLVDLKGAEDEMNNPSFIQNPPKPLKKKLLFDFDSLNRHIDNFEGMTFGPKLPNGHYSLLFLTDNNFSKNQLQQVFLFDVMP